MLDLESYVIAVAVSANRTENCYQRADLRWEDGSWDLLGMSYQSLYLAKKYEQRWGSGGSDCVSEKLRECAEFLINKWQHRDRG